MSRSAGIRFCVASVACVALATALLGCGNEGPPRPQLVVVIDTDAPVVGQLEGRPELSPDATVDTVRVDAIGPDGSAFDLRDFVAPEAADWPISFGVSSPEAPVAGPVRLRVRAFRGAFARPGELAGIATLDPPSEVTLDRVIDLVPPTEGVLHVRVLLASECMGVRPVFGSKAATCVDAAHQEASPAEGVEELAEDAAPASLVGTWPEAAEVPCGRAPTADQVCIPGGFSVLGDLDLTGVADFLLLDSVPLRPALLPPLLMDRTEVTVRQLRELVNAGGFDAALPIPRDATDSILSYCTWLGADDSTNDDFPVNCITWETAARACELRGGKLPTEAQWEHAARGRGQRRLFPWGNEESTCCTASASRKGPPEIQVECEGSGVEPVGSHPEQASCNGIGDVSRDGALDLGGSVSEATLDKYRPYSDPCWQKAGILRDPQCSDDTASSRASRGGSWSSGLAIVLGPLRHPFTKDIPTNGFRCVYEGRDP